MKILFVTHYGQLLGANRSLLHLIRGLRDRYGVEATVWCPSEGELTETLRAQGFRYRCAPFANWAYSLRSPGLWTFPLRWLRSRWGVLPELLRIAESEQFDWIYSNSIAVSLGWQLAEPLGMRHAWHLRELGSSDWLIFPLGKNFLQKKLASAQRLIAISGAVRDAHPACAKTLTRVVYNGVGDRAAFERRRAGAESRVRDGVFRLISVGLIHPSKAQHEAIEAFALLHRKYPQTRLVIVGDGRKAYLRRLKTLAERLAPEAIEFTGYVRNPDPLFAASDALVFCGRNEGMGRVIAEAMSYGLPVLRYRDRGAEELIRDGYNGYLYDDVAQLSAQMELLTAQPAHREAMGRNAWDFAYRHFTDEAYVSAVWEFLNVSLSTP